jgi:hypothetical protein
MSLFSLFDNLCIDDYKSCLEVKDLALYLDGLLNNLGLNVHYDNSFKKNYFNNFILKYLIST